jgi:hypothetical protein
VKFCKVGGKIITQTGEKVLELVKDGSKVLLKESGELGKALAGPKLEPALAGPVARLPQAASKELPTAAFSKKTGTGGGGGKSAPKPEPPKAPRIVNTPADCTKYIDNKVSSKICQKDKVDGNKQYFKIIKKDGILKKGDYIYKDTRHHEIELMKSDLKTHKGAIDPKTGNLYKEGVPGRNIKGLK